MGSDRNLIVAIEDEYRRFKTLGEKTMSQLSLDQLALRPTPESLSVAMLAWHISGNLTSRFTDFLTSDGEKPWRGRDTEFEARHPSREELLEKWEAGWKPLFDTLESLSDKDLERSVLIRGYSLSVVSALQRSLGHVSYHVGQMAYLGKMFLGKNWEYLSTPPGGSLQFHPSPPTNSLWVRP